MKNKEPTPQQAPTGRGRGRGGPNRAAASNIIQGRQNLRTIDKQDKNIWIHLVHHLRREKLLPVVIFVFSKRRCEENAAVLTNIDLCTASEKSEVHIVVEKSIARLKVEDRRLTSDTQDQGFTWTWCCRSSWWIVTHRQGGRQNHI